MFAVFLNRKSIIKSKMRSEAQGPLYPFRNNQVTVLGEENHTPELKIVLCCEVTQCCADLNTWEILHSSPLHLSSVRELSPSPQLALFYGSPSFTCHCRFMDSKQGRVSPTLSCLLRPSVFRHRPDHFALVFHGSSTVVTNL